MNRAEPMIDELRNEAARLRLSATLVHNRDLAQQLDQRAAKLEIAARRRSRGKAPR